jgi:putative endonuclease
MPKYQHKQQSAFYKTSKQKGDWAEDIACKWLVNQGLTVKQKNFYTRYGEIDLVMNGSSQLIF